MIRGKVAEFSWESMSTPSLEPELAHAETGSFGV